MRVALVLKAVKWLGVGLLLAVFAVLSLPDADVPSPGHFIFLFALLGVWLAWIPFSLRNLSWRRGFLVLAAITLVAPVVVFSHMLFDLTNVSFPPPTTAEDAIELVKKHRLEGGDLTVGEAVEHSARDGTQPQWEASRVDPDNDTVLRWWVRIEDYQFTITFLGGVREGFFGG